MQRFQQHRAFLLYGVYFSFTLVPLCCLQLSDHNTDGIEFTEYSEKLLSSGMTKPLFPVQVEWKKTHGRSNIMCSQMGLGLLVKAAKQVLLMCKY